MTNCDANLLYDDDAAISISDDGSIAAFTGFVQQGSQTVNTMWIINAQTGAVLFTKTAPDGGPVQVSENGTWVAWTTGDSVVIYSSATGAVRDTIQMDWNCEAQLSDDGSYVAFAGQDKGSIYKWNAANAQYVLAFSPVPSGATQWYATSAAISSDGSGKVEGEIATFAYITDSALQARVIMYSMVDGSVLADYTSPANTALQTYATVRASGNYCGISLWGDNDDVPTAVVIAAGAAKPVFTYTTPGSMFGVDIVHDIGQSTPTQDIIYFSVAGKHTPAVSRRRQGKCMRQRYQFLTTPAPFSPPQNVMGNGGDAFTWQIVVPV